MSGISSRASAKALTAYYSTPLILSASLATSIAQASSVAPPPPTTLLFLTMFLTTQRASWRHLLASSQIVLLPPLIRIVIAFDLEQSEINITLSLVVPKEISLIDPAFPNFSGVISSNLGMILPPVAIAISSISTPPTHLTAGSSFYINKWFASSSNPHWQSTTLAPESLTYLTMSTKYFYSKL